MAGVSYVLWRYAYTPWMVMRKDIAALNQKIDDHQAWVKAELGLRSIKTLTDEDLAHAEAIQRRNAVRTRLFGS